MTTSKTDFKQGDSVIVKEGDREVKGTVESIQLHPLREGQKDRAVNKIDVRIFQKGHDKHGLIIPVDPADVKMGEKAAPAASEEEETV